MSDEFPVADAIRLDKFKNELQQDRPVRTTQRTDISAIFNAENLKRNRSSSASNRQKLKTHQESRGVSMDQEINASPERGAVPRSASFDKTILRSQSSDRNAAVSMSVDKIVSDDSPMDTPPINTHWQNRRRTVNHGLDSTRSTVNQDLDNTRSTVNQDLDIIWSTVKLIQDRIQLTVNFVRVNCH